MSTLRVNGLKPRTGNTVTIVEGNTLSVTGIASVAGTMNVTGQANFASGANVTGVVTFANADLNSNLTVSSLTSNGTVEVGAGKSIKLNGASSGYTEIIAAAGSGSTTFVLPANGGSASQYLQTDGSGVLSWATVVSDSGAEWTDGTAYTSLSGSGTFTFTGIPSNIKELIVTMNGVSWTTGGTIRFRLRTGGSSVTSGYASSYAYLSSGATVSAGQQTNSFELGVWTSASHGVSGIGRFVNTTGNLWAFSSNWRTSFDSSSNLVQGHVDVGGTLDGIELFNGNGNNFDGGNINIHYITT